jgi:hypothetical protein
MGSVALGLSQIGAALEQAKAQRRQEQMAQAKLAMEQGRYGMQQQQGQQQLARGKAPEVVRSFQGADGKQYDELRDPLTGRITYQASTAPAEAKGTFKPILTESGDYVLYNDVTRETKPMELDGKPIKGFPKGKNSPLIIDGKPAGVIRNGQPLTPTSPEWTDADQTQLDSYLKTYKESEAGKDARVKLAATSRIEAYMKTRMYGALDAQTGSLVYVSPDQMRSSPGRYAPAGPGVQAKNRMSIFQEIDTTKSFLSDAIAKLPNEEFSPQARLQLSYVLRDEDPRGAWHNFLNSDVAATLSESQINYVTALVSMDESAMSLRSLAGMGAGSDMLRSAIMKMLPGAGTPSKEYAMRQMQIFSAEVQALKTSVPNIGEPGQGGGETKGGNAPPQGSKIIKWEDVK